MSKREALLSALAQLRVAHPALPQLRDFQVSPGPLQAVCIQQQQYVFNTMSSVGYTNSYCLLFVLNNNADILG